MVTTTEKLGPIVARVREAAASLRQCRAELLELPCGCSHRAQQFDKKKCGRCQAVVQLSLAAGHAGRAISEIN